MLIGVTLDLGLLIVLVTTYAIAFVFSSRTLSAMPAKLESFYPIKGASTVYVVSMVESLRERSKSASA
jgi:hypothetical protein